MSRLFLKKLKFTYAAVVVAGWVLCWSSPDISAQVTVQTYTVTVPHLQDDEDAEEQETEVEADANVKKVPPPDPTSSKDGAEAQDDSTPTVEVVADAEEALEDEDEEDEEEAAVANVIANWGTTKSKVLGAKKFLLEQDFTVEVEQAIEVCDLDERQLKKLKIASRGAIKKAYEKWKTKGMQQLGIPNFGNADDDSDEEAITPEVYTDADDIDQMTMQVAGGMMFNPFKTEAPTDSKFWKNALKASLGEEQHRKLMKYRAERDRIKKEKIVASSVETLALEMRLSDEQKKAFSDLVTPKMLETSTSIGPMYEQFVMYYHASKASKSKLKKILTKAQFQKWKTAMAPVKEIGQMIGEQNALDAQDDEEVGAWEEVGEALETVGEAVEVVVDYVEGVLDK